jgi:hypothetical protein
MQSTLENRENIQYGLLNSQRRKENKSIKQKKREAKATNVNNYARLRKGDVNESGDTV